MPTNVVPTASQSSSSPITNTSLDRTTMVAPSILDRGRFSWVWVVPACPYCHKSHDHYAGPLDADPYVYVGRMFTARCDSTDRRRLATEYPSLSLWYMLEPIQTQERVPEPRKSRTVGGK